MTGMRGPGFLRTEEDEKNTLKRIFD